MARSFVRFVRLSSVGSTDESFAQNAYRNRYISYNIYLLSFHPMTLLLRPFLGIFGVYIGPPCFYRTKVFLRADGHCKWPASDGQHCAPPVRWQEPGATDAARSSMAAHRPALWLVRQIKKSRPKGRLSKGARLAPYIFIPPDFIIPIFWAFE